MKYGYWSLTGKQQRKRGELYLECECECGTLRAVRKVYLENGASKSCGCMRGTFIADARRTHGHSGRDNTATRTYNSWRGMVVRCTNEDHHAYHNYGGRGIKVCRRWEKFDAFLKDMGERPEGKELDRKNNGKGYCKSNCRWAERKLNSRNTRASKVWVIEGRKYAASREAAEAEGVTRATIRRWCLGYTPPCRGGGVTQLKEGCFCYSTYED